MVHIGCCGWAKAQSAYITELDAVEVQQTFYEPPQRSTLERWRRLAPSGFEFTVKCFQLVTHERTSPTYRRLRRPLPNDVEVGHLRDHPIVRAAWGETLECARILRAPVLLVQTPARFEPTQENLRRLHAFASWGAAPRITIAFEPRGPAWRADFTDRLCRELGWLRAGDPFLAPPPDPRMQKTAYFRLHGRTGYRYQFSSQDLRELAQWVRAYEEAWVFFNNRTMWDDALAFRRLWTSRGRHSGGS